MNNKMYFEVGKLYKILKGERDIFSKIPWMVHHGAVEVPAKSIFTVLDVRYRQACAEDELLYTTDIKRFLYEIKVVVDNKILYLTYLLRSDVCLNIDSYFIEVETTEDNVC
jgi:hypothetical protein